MSVVEEIFLDVSPLKSLDKLQLVEKILTSLNPIDKEIETIWANEVEDRLDAYDKGLLSTVSAKDVFAKYQK
jgi:putative addiction module component (TIGR02574 family)